MIHSIRGIFDCQPQEYLSKRNLLSSDIILMIALGALAFFSAKAFERKDPALARLLRYSPAIFGLILLFKRSYPNHAYKKNSPPIFIHHVSHSPEIGPQTYGPAQAYPQSQAYRSQTYTQTEFPRAVPIARQHSRFSEVRDEPAQGSPFTNTYSASHSFGKESTSYSENQRPIFESRDQRPY